MSSSEDVQLLQVPHSSVLLLLQEATNLPAPADEERSGPGDTADGSSEVTAGPRSEVTGSFTVVRGSDHSSAWEVMCLINQQCERLLRSGCEVRGQTDHRSDCEVSGQVDLPSSHVSSVCVPVTPLYSSEHTDLNSGEPAAGQSCSGEHTSALTTEEPSAAPSTGKSCDITSCLVSESVCRRLPDLNNNVLQEQQQECVCRRRKQPRPARSPDPQDPELQAVTFRMTPQLEPGAGRSRLLITSNYSEELSRWRSRRSRCRSLHSAQRSSSSEEESDPCSLSGSKICASCRTRKTPLWRDAEDGTPLCNACGIRYKKYRVRCQQCWNIPKKEANTHSQCLKCGDVLKMKSGGW
ncbi:GATA-type zinc finger protein 1 [Danio rerio]|uniref:GATA-type zinc finger protein 1 n=1 Tax=Danio rerio TaxID=7955 RepID=Q0P432_DANRE|nr:GATA-type zinc finger protein 1 [Danio rerio]AAI22299.1 Zgc:153462 [Danio rerio]|eukprot:NP_001038914.1 GATA-type zinc finger protein 1 [Danio rerio]